MEVGGDAEFAATQFNRLNRFGDAFKRMTRTSFIELVDKPSQQALSFDQDGAPFRLPLKGVIDLDTERARLAKSLEAAEKEAAALDKRLSNPQFIEKAKPEAVEKARSDHGEKTAEAERLRAALARLG